MSTCSCHINQLTTYNRYDPTQTTVLRNQFVREMNKRFRALRGKIRQAIVEQDVFGSKNPMIQQAPGNRAFTFPRSQDKVQAFMQWLRREIDSGMLEVSTISQVGQPIDRAWTNLYVQDSYQRGVLRARAELRNAGFNIPAIEQTGGIAVSMSTPFHLDRVGLLYTRVFNELKGITTQMDTQISRILAQGMADGDNPITLARKLNRTISGPMGDLGITDTLGRFIPAERRARIMARTEIIRAHHQATIQEYRNWAVEGVKVKAEWRTAGDTRVCDECLGWMKGGPYTLDQIEPMIPVHPQCRCIALPLDVTNVKPKR